MTAQEVVDALTEGKLGDWLSDTTEFVKDATGIGRDSFGLGKNTEKKWKPKYNVDPHKKYQPKPKRHEKTTWKLDTSP